MAVRTLRMMTRMKKNVFVLEKPNRETYCCRMKLRHEYLDETYPFHTNEILYFHAFRISSVVIQEVFCSSIPWRIQRSVKLLRWNVLRKTLWEKTL